MISGPASRDEHLPFVRQTLMPNYAFVRIAIAKNCVMLGHMKSPHSPVALPLDYAVELATEMHMMRSECCDAAQDLTEQKPLDEVGLEECALLDEALAAAQLLLHKAVAGIRTARANRGYQSI